MPACKAFRHVDIALVNSIISPSRNSSVRQEDGQLLMLSLEYVEPINRTIRLSGRLPAHDISLQGYKAFELHQDAPYPAPAREWPTPPVTGALLPGIYPG